MLASLVRYTPPPGSTEWHQGAASMANDPLDRRRYNAAFRFYRGESDLAPKGAFLGAIRSIRQGDEILVAYGSMRPFRGFKGAHT